MANREALLAYTFLRLADTLVADFDVIEVLSTLSARCVELLDAAASGIVLADQNGTLQVVAASSEAVNVLELFQVQNDEGPCRDAFRTAATVADGDLRVGDRWPRFAPMAVAAGYESVHAFPPGGPRQRAREPQPVHDQARAAGDGGRGDRPVPGARPRP